MVNGCDEQSRTKHSPQMPGNWSQVELGRMGHKGEH